MAVAWMLMMCARTMLKVMTPGAMMRARPIAALESRKSYQEEDRQKESCREKITQGGWEKIVREGDQLKVDHALK